MIITDSIVGFFIEKSVDKILGKQKDEYQKRNLEKKIREYSENFFTERFHQISLLEEFDYEGLNTFLYENFEGKLFACYNAPEYKQRIFFKEQLIREAYQYARADTKNKQDAVYFYVQSILYIIKNTLLKRVDEMEWFLAGCVVTDVQENVKGLLNSYSKQLNEFIRFHNSFADTIDSTIHHFDIENEYHYLRKNIYFQGRKDSLEYLDNFLSAPDELLYAVITGRGGIGKSKLMHHYMLRGTSDLEWKIVFPTHKQIDQFINQHIEWNYPKNLLVIIDYVGEISDIIGKWINILTHTNKRPLKMRIVLLERQGIVVDINGMKSYPYWYKKISESAGHNFDKLLYEGSFYSLGPLDESDLFLLMNNIAHNKEKVISQQNKIKIYKQAKEWGSSNNPDQFTTPLMIILLTDAFLDKNSLKHFSSSTLMDYIITKFQNYWLKTICDGDKVLYDSLEKLLVYATATGGWDIKPLPGPLAEASTIFLNHYRKTNLKLILTEINEKANQDNFIFPLEPDIVGEYFVLWYLSETTLTTYYNDFIKLLWSKPDHFSYFLNRCISSYLCDDDFYDLVEGEYSLLGEWCPVDLRVTLLVNLSKEFPLDKCKKIIEILSDLLCDEWYQNDQEMMTKFAKGLFNLLINQDSPESKETLDRIAELARDKKHDNNHDIIYIYASGLASAILGQHGSDHEEIIKRLAELAHDRRYSNNEKIILTYARGLYANIIVKKGVDCEEIIKALAELMNRFSGNQDIVSTYALGLVLIIRGLEDQEAKKMIVKKLARLEEEYSDNLQIALSYARGLTSIIVKQSEPDSVETIKELARLAEKHSDNQDLASSYVTGLMFRANKVIEGDEIVKELARLAEKFNDNQYIVGMHPVINHLLMSRQDTYSGVEYLAGVIQQEKYKDNELILYNYAESLLDLLEEQNTLDSEETIEQLAGLAKRFSDNLDIVTTYVKGLKELLIKQDIQDRVATMELLTGLAKDGRYKDNSDITEIYFDAKLFYTIHNLVV